MVYTKKRKLKTKKNKYSKSRVKKIRKKIKSKRGGDIVVKFATSFDDITYSLSQFTVNKFRQFLSESKHIHGRRPSKQRDLLASPDFAPTKQKKIRRSSGIKLKHLAEKVDSTPNTITTELSKSLEKTSSVDHYINFFNGKKIILWHDYVNYLKKKPTYTEVSYNEFREFFIDFHIVNLLKKDLERITNYSIKKNISNHEYYTLLPSRESETRDKKYILLYKSGDENTLEIFFEMIGSKEVTSDYDVSIWSNPPNTVISNLNYYFNIFFTTYFKKSSGEIFDTNIYTHPIYLFKIPEQYFQKYFLKIDQERFMVNPGNSDFFNNEKVFANFLFLKGTKKNDDSEDTETAYYGTNLKLKEDTRLNRYNDLTLDDLSENDFSENSELFFEIFLTKDFKILPNIKSLCLDVTKPLKDKKCKNRPVDMDNTNESNLRKQIENSINEYLIESLTVPENWLELFKKKYIAPMRAALALADETYTTFSSYFHVIHIMATPEKSITSIDYLLSTPSHKEELKNICVVSAIENFAFMFHYYELGISDFVKKTSKYLSRISHACFLRKQLIDPEVTSDKIRDKILTKQDIGCSNSIVNKFKRNKRVVPVPTSENNFYNMFNLATNPRSGKTTISLLEEIYNELIKKEGETSIYGITSDDLIIYI